MGGLFERSFDSNCPPVVTPETTILAVCGPHDVDNSAAPDNDGWFFSDFYLFHHLFRGTAKKQYWLTCVKPQDLISKYKEFVYGDPRSSDRRVVLDETFADEVRDVIVFHGEDLLERFLSYFANICRASKDTKSPILVMIFGHGMKKTFSITIGVVNTNPLKNPQLVPEKFKEAMFRHDSHANVALVTTSCCGEGWVQTGLFNITGMAGCVSGERTLSWPGSGSIGRFCGSRYAKRVAQALIRSEIKSLDPQSEAEIQQSSTYAAFVVSIHDIFREQVDSIQNKGISFLAKDDLWGMEWRARTGFPLAGYREKWESLRLVPASSSRDIALSGSVKFTDYIHLPLSAAEFRIKRLAYDYMASKPGDDADPTNHRVHTECRKLLGGKSLSKDDLEDLAGSLNYRLNDIMERATEYKNHLGISFSDCHHTDVESLMKQIRKSKNNADRQYEILSMVVNSNLFDEPGKGEGMDYDKGEIYLSVIPTQSKMTRSNIEEALAGLVRFNQETNPLHVTMRVFRFWEMPEVRDMVGTLAKSFHKRLRSQSPSNNLRSKLIHYSARYIQCQKIRNFLNM